MFIRLSQEVEIKVLSGTLSGSRLHVQLIRPNARHVVGAILSQPLLPKMKNSSIAKELNSAKGWFTRTTQAQAQASATCEPGRRKHKHKKKERALVLASSRFTRGLMLMLVLASYV